MNKTITITLNKIIFHIEENAYQKLKEYLDAVREHLGNDADKDEVMADIEASIAEKFSAKLSAANQVITETEVSELIKVMGTIEDFDKELSEVKTGQKNEGQSGGQEKKVVSGEKTIKKLYRNPDDAIIAGVCSGIAAYFATDPLLIRLIFFATIFFGGAGVVLYLILWFIVPKAITGGQKLEMQGDPVTLAGIEQTVKKNVEKIKNAKDNESVKSWIRRLVELPFDLIRLVFSIIGKVFRAIMPVIRILFGLGFALFPLIGVVFLTFFGFIIAFRLDHPYLISDIPLTEFSHEPAFHLGILSAYLVALIPMVFSIILGISLIRKKSSFSVLSVGGLLGIWMIAIICASAIGFDYAPRIEQKINEYRTRETVTKNFDLKDFNKVAAGGNYDIEIKKGDNYSITAQGMQKEIERMGIAAEDGQLIIKQASRKSGIYFICLDNFKTKLTITMPDLKAYRGDGVTRLKTAGFSGDELKIDLEGVARADINANYKKLIINNQDTASLVFTGSSTVMEINLKDVARLNYGGNVTGRVKLTMSDVSSTELKGQAESLAAQLRDTSRLDAFFFPVNTADMAQSDVSRSEINAAKSIKATLKDVSRLNYTGTAEVQSDSAGSRARINKVDRAGDLDEEINHEDEFEEEDNLSASGGTNEVEAY